MLCLVCYKGIKCLVLVTHCLYKDGLAKFNSGCFSVSENLRFAPKTSLQQLCIYVPVWQLGHRLPCFSYYKQRVYNSSFGLKGRKKNCQWLLWKPIYLFKFIINVFPQTHLYQGPHRDIFFLWFQSLTRLLTNRRLDGLPSKVPDEIKPWPRKLIKPGGKF